MSSSSETRITRHRSWKCASPATCCFVPTWGTRAERTGLIVPLSGDQERFELAEMPRSSTGRSCTRWLFDPVELSFVANPLTGCSRAICARIRRAFGPKHHHLEPRLFPMICHGSLALERNDIAVWVARFKQRGYPPISRPSTKKVRFTWVFLVPVDIACAQV